MQEKARKLITVAPAWIWAWGGMHKALMGVNGATQMQEPACFLFYSPPSLPSPPRCRRACVRQMSLN